MGLYDRFFTSERGQKLPIFAIRKKKECAKYIKLYIKI
jgi:hypothetical protein